VAVTPDPTLTRAVGACLLAALAARTRWDEDPELALLAYDGTTVTARPIPLPRAIWAAGPHRDTLAALARGIVGARQDRGSRPELMTGPGITLDGAIPRTITTLHTTITATRN
jgi:hypothetical protein